MSDLPAFDEFFQEVWGATPYRWQVDLAEQVIAAQRWPDCIDLPTGAGKTACLDIAVYTMAVEPLSFPRRVAFVVDRRLLVDQTVERAQELSSQLQRALTGGGHTKPAVAAIARRLVGLAAPSPGRPPMALDVGRLRGGLGDRGRRAADPSEWLRWPDQPAVVVSTVDQFGSRLLFRGYGVGARMRPVHAGLTGNDCLVLLDEVHISAAVAETLADLTTGFTTVRGLPRRWQFVRMSATPNTAAGRTFSLDRPRHAPPGSALERVVDARKLARTVAIGKPKQPDAEAWGSYIPWLVDQLGIAAGVVGVVVNRVASARTVAQALASLGEVALLTGRMRPLDRDEAEQAARRLADPKREPGSARAFVVATQCIEVGADLSFDALITEACPLSALKQRFGRLDRRGHNAAAGAPSPALIVGVASALARDRDPVYGSAMKTMWEELRHRYGDEQFDVGSMSNTWDDLPDGVDVPVAHPAVLMPAYLDLLAMTNPVPSTSPDVSVFLRGFEQHEPEVSVVWREDVACTPGSWERDRAVLTLLPPSPLEMLALPRAAVVRWLRNAPAVAVADVDSLSEDDDDQAVAASERWVWRVLPGERPQRIRASEVRGGDVIVVPSTYGGLAGAVWAPESDTAVCDVAGRASALDGRRVIRTAVDLGLEGPLVPTADEFDDFVAEVAARLDEGEPWMAGADTSRLVDIGTVEQPLWVIEEASTPTITSFDGSDEANSAIGVEVPLPRHLAGVGEFAAAFAERCGLSDELVADFRRAGELHDLGKADPRFQVMLYGDEIRALGAEQLLAKSVHRRRWFRGGYPVGMRHEYASAELIASSAELLAQSHDPDLVMHLVTTHHGHGRALAIHVDDPDPVTIEVESHGHRLTARSSFECGAVGSASVERFVRLNRRYGWHGLAWLEALFRLADHRRSEEESRGTAS